MREISYKSPLYIQLREVIRSKIEEEEYLPSHTLGKSADGDLWAQPGVRSQCAGGAGV